MLTKNSNNYFIPKVIGVFFLIIASAKYIAVYGKEPAYGSGYTEYYYQSAEDTTKKAAEDTLKFPIPQSRNIDPEANTQNSLYLQDPQAINRVVEYVPEDSGYYMQEKAGDYDLKSPYYLTEDQYFDYRADQDEQDYFRQRLAALSMFDKKPDMPVMYREGLFDRLFGSKTMSVKPQGRLELMFGYNHNKIDNPSMPERVRNYGNFDFDMDMNLNILAEVGDKLKLNISQNTRPSFGEQQQRKIEFTGKEDEILKKIELGNVSFPLNSGLINGVQSLFGAKTQLQFGRLWLTGVLSRQNSQRKSISVQGGGQKTEFEIKADDYDENRNFLLAQYFYNNYERALENIPIINSQVVLNRVEVWVTNRQGATQNVRDVLAFMDLGESQPYQSFLANGGSDLPDNASNRLYQLIQQNPAARNQGTASQVALGLGLIESQDFHRVTMRRLNESEFTFHPQLGFVSLNSNVNPDDVIAVSYRYTYNGKTYQVGEFSTDVSPDSTDTKVMYMKMLKGTASRPKLPVWNLMMKNVYSLGYGRMTKEDFRLNVMYLDPGGGRKRYLPDGPEAGVPIIKLLNLDNLNQQNDPIPDGLFDYVDGLTIIPNNGKVIFPVLEPFGDGLKAHLGGSPQLERRYLYNMLYDSTKTIARQFNQNNRFVIQGSYKGEGGSDIPLGFNIPEGSVTVTAGGQVLQENVDYQVDYSMGRVKILNAALLSSGVPINISYEDNANFGLVPQTFIGLRADYFFNKKLSLGGTYMRLSERPLTTTVQYGYDPIKNTVAGLDLNYQSEFMALTRALDKLPFYSTATPSLIDLKGEVAGIFPGHHKFINVLDPEGSIAMDNFEGANSSIDIRFPVTQWTLSSVPSGAKNANGTTLFPESNRINDLSYGFNRAKIAWYTVDQNLLQRTSAPPHLLEDTEYEAYWRLINTSEVFPDKQVLAQNSIISTLDLSYFPKKRGPYNFTTNDLNRADGQFTTPRDKFGGIMRALDNNNSDFEQANVEYITFWALDPFIYNPNSAGGDLYINIGNVSEDVLKDGRMTFENGIPTPDKDITKLKETPWGYTPTFSQQLTRVFEADVDSRKIQDVGFDALNDDEERSKYASFLNTIQGLVSPEIYQALYEDPSNDNFVPYRSAEHDNAEHGIITRYENINNPHGNSPANEGGNFVGSITTIPESEDLNKDNSLNESESYFQYRVRLMPEDHPSMQVGENHIVNRRVASVTMRDGTTQEQTWYQFKIPIRAYDHTVGNISDFRSIRFFRMFLTDFEDSLTLRMAQLQFDRSQWRTYLYSLDKPGEIIPLNDTLNTTFAVTSVSIEQNSSKAPVGYKSPPGVDRQQQPAGATGVIIRDDERSLAFQVCELKDGDARAAFKEVSMDIRQNDYLRMFVHAESVPGQPALRDNDLQVFIRIGSDFINNYYEYRIPLKVTGDGEINRDLIWPEANRLDLELNQLVTLKNTRNSQGLAAYIPYEQIDEKGNPMIVIGNPNLGEVRNVMIGVINPKKSDNPNDDGLPKCTEIWLDELRVAGFNEQAGYAASAQANIQLADLGSVHVGGSMHTIGYGNIDQKLNSRFRDNYYNFDVNTNLNLGKLMPNSWGVQLPVYVGYIENVSNPEYDPYDLDVKLNDKLNAYTGDVRDSIRKAAQTFTSVTSFSISNFRIAGGNGGGAQNRRPMLWSAKNFDLSYNYNRAYARNPLLESDIYTTQRLGLGYNYETGAKSIEPFKKTLKSNSKWLRWVKDFNFKPYPSAIGFNTNLYKIFGETIIRNIDNDPYQLDPLYIQNFTWDRVYTVRWDLANSISLNYTGTNVSRIDEPYGRITNEAQRDTLWSSISRFGRNTMYNHNINTSYKLPTSKIRLVDWTNVTLTYNTTYNWTAASMLASDLGHTITNTQTKQVNAELNFSQLYNRSRHLKAAQSANNLSGFNTSNISTSATKDEINSKLKDNKEKFEAERKKNRGRDKVPVPPKPEKKKIKITDVPGHDSLEADTLRTAWKALKKAERKKHRTEVRAWRAKKKRIVPGMSEGTRYALRAATMLKRVSINFSENSGSILPGFMDTSRNFGSTLGGNNWFDFALGYQPNQQWIENRAVNGQFTRDSIFNQQIRQTITRNINIRAVLEPMDYMRIDVTLTRNFNKEYNETFKYDQNNEVFGHLSPFTTGSFSTTFIGLNTFFNNREDNYKNFLSNRGIISRRLGEVNPYTNGTQDPNNNNYTKGYTEFSQDVLIPAFLAAYGGRKTEDVPLMNTNSNDIRSNPFKGYLPMPNWKLTYNGLSHLDVFQGKVKNINITHGYTGTMNMNSFTSNLTYLDMFGVGYPSFIDSVTNNYIPFFQVPNITIQESFSPIVGVDLLMESGLSLKVEYKRSRITSLNLIDYQISETNSQDIIFGFGHRLKGVKLPFSFFGITELENDLNLRIDIAYRDDITVNTHFAGSNEQPTRGQWTLTIAPRAEYMVNDNLQLVGYYERRQSYPYVLNSYPLVNTKFGIKLIYLFNQ